MKKKSIALRNGSKLTKTFMSVIYGSGRAEIAMKKAGHPNIFLFGPRITTDLQTKRRKFWNKLKPLRLKVKKGANQTVTSIGYQGVTALKVLLKEHVTKDLPIKDGKVELPKHYLTALTHWTMKLKLQCTRSHSDS